MRVAVRLSAVRAMVVWAVLDHYAAAAPPFPHLPLYQLRWLLLGACDREDIWAEAKDCIGEASSPPCSLPPEDV